MFRNLRKHKLLVPVLGMAVIYAFQFLILPSCFPRYYPVSNEAWAILLIPLAVFSVLMNLLTDVRPGSWAVADLVYGILVALCNGSGLYGIGKRGLALAGMTPSYSPELAVITAFIIALILLVFQVLLHAIRAVFAKIKHP